MKLKTLLGLCGAFALCACAGRLLAQEDPGAPPGPPPDAGAGGPGDFGPDGPGGPGRPGGRGAALDPAQLQRMMIDQARQSLDVTNDDEWAAIQPLIQKVLDARRAVDMGGGPGMRVQGGPGGPGAGPGGPGAGPRAFGAGPGARAGVAPQITAERRALRKALDDNAPAAQIKAALDKYRAALQDKQSKLDAAKANLKSILSTEQEARAVLSGLL